MARERRVRTSKGRETASQTSSRARKMLNSSLKKTGNTVRKGRSSGLSSRQVNLLKNGDNNAGIDQNLVSNYRSGSGAITSDSVRDTANINLPTPTQGEDLSAVTNGINTTLGSYQGGSYEQGKGFVPAPTAESTPESNQDALFRSFLGTNEEDFNNQQSRESLTREMQDELRPIEARRNSIQNQLTSIANVRDEKILGLEGQGRGVTDTIIGGQQAKIGRDAAIDSLSLQTQLAAAQGDLDSARSYLGQLFTAKTQDATNEYNYRTQLNASVYSFLDGQEKRAMDAKNKQLDRDFGVEQANIAFQRQLGMQAIEFGQSGLISGISALDPASPTFEADMAGFTAQLRKPVAAAGPSKRDTQMVDGKLVDMQTGEVITDMSAATDPETIQKSIDQFAFIRTTIEDAQDLTSATGPNMINQALGNFFVGNTRVKQLATKLDTLKVNLLTLSTDPAVKGFFGPQMSDNDSRLMLAGGTTMDAYTNTEEGLNAELLRYDGLVNRIQTAVTEGQKAQAAGLPMPAAGQNVLTAPDGQLIEIIPE